MSTGFKEIDSEMQKQLGIIDALANQINSINKKEEEIKHSNLNSIDDKTIFLYQFIGILNHIDDKDEDNPKIGLKDSLKDNQYVSTNLKIEDWNEWDENKIEEFFNFKNSKKTYLTNYKYLNFLKPVIITEQSDSSVPKIATQSKTSAIQKKTPAKKKNVNFKYSIYKYVEKEKNENLFFYLFHNLLNFDYYNNDEFNIEFINIFSVISVVFIKYNGTEEGPQNCLVLNKIKLNEKNFYLNLFTIDNYDGKIITGVERGTNGSFFKGIYTKPSGSSPPEIHKLNCNKNDKDYLNYIDFSPSDGFFQKITLTSYKPEMIFKNIINPQNKVEKKGLSVVPTIQKGLDMKKTSYTLGKVKKYLSRFLANGGSANTIKKRRRRGLNKTQKNNKAYQIGGDVKEEGEFKAYAICYNLLEILSTNSELDWAKVDNFRRKIENLNKFKEEINLMKAFNSFITYLKQFILYHKKFIKTYQF